MNKSSLWDPYRNFQKTVLENGLSIYSAYWDRPWMHVRFCVHSGSLEDPEGQEGLAHFVEHMLSERPAKMTFKKTSKFFKDAGGSAAFGNTDPYGTYFSFELPLKRKVISAGLEIFGNMLLFPLESENFESEKKIVLREFKEHFPLKFQHDILIKPYRQAYQGTRFEKFQNVLGNPESISVITMENLRMFFDKHYVPANISIVAAGGFSHNEFVQIVKDSCFSISKIGTRNPLPNLLPKIEYPASPGETLFFSELLPGMPIENASLSSHAIIPGPTSRDIFKLIYGIWDETLFEEIRVREGESYQVNVSWEFLGDAYALHVNLTCNPKNIKRVKELVLKETLASLRDQKKFKIKKKHFIRNFFINDLDMGTCCKELERNLIRYDRILFASDDMESIQKLPFEEYSNVIEYLLDPKRWWSLIQVP